jgi:hypothetical protein
MSDKSLAVQSNNTGEKNVRSFEVTDKTQLLVIYFRLSRRDKRGT